jgi:hypothetical protein
VVLEWEAESLVLGLLASLAGLTLLGLRYPITRLLEGYPLEHPWLRRVHDWLVLLQARSYDRLKKRRDDETTSEATQAKTARLLDRRFHINRDRLLPTRFGNAFRATENYSFIRYGLDGVAIWPRIDSLLSERERELHTHAASDLAFFVNGTIWTPILGVVVGVDRTWPWWAYLIPLALTYFFYRASIGAAERVEQNGGQASIFIVSSCMTSSG